MKLRGYLKKNGLSQRKFARKVKTSQTMVNFAVTAFREIPLGLAMRIQWETGGEVMARELPISFDNHDTLELMRKLVAAGERF